MPVHVSLLRKPFLALALETPRSRFALAILFALVLSLLGCGGTDPAELSPKLRAADPGFGTSGTMVVLTGSDFQAGCRVAFGTLPAPAVTFVSSNTVLAFAPEGLAADAVYAVRVTNPGGQTDELSDAFRSAGPELNVVNGVSRPSGPTGSVVLLEGRSFGDLLGGGRVYFTGAQSRPVEARVDLDHHWNNEVIVAEVPAGAVSGPVWVATATGESRPIRFTVGEGFVDAPSGIPRAVLGPFPQERSHHGLVLATSRNALLETTETSHLYVVGGLDSGGRPQRTVYRVPVHLDRRVGDWMAELDLPQALHSMGIVVHRSWVYVAGGVTGDGTATAAVYRARIHRDGSLGLWEHQPSLPAPRSLPVLRTEGGVLTARGGHAEPGRPESRDPSVHPTSSTYSHEIAIPSGELIGAWVHSPQP